MSLPRKIELRTAATTSMPPKLTGCDAFNTCMETKALRLKIIIVLIFVAQTIT